MKVGTYVSGTFKPIDLQLALIPGQVYELRASTVSRDIIFQNRVIYKLLALDIPGVEITWVETSTNSVTLQLMVSPLLAGQPVSLFWAALLPLLLPIIAPLGAVIIGIIIAGKIPEWALAVPFIGAGFAIMIYAFMKAKK